MEILLAGVLAIYIILELCKKVDARDQMEQCQKEKQHQSPVCEKKPQFVMYSRRPLPHTPDSAA